MHKQNICTRWIRMQRAGAPRIGISTRREEEEQEEDDRKLELHRVKHKMQHQKYIDFF